MLGGNGLRHLVSTAFVPSLIALLLVGGLLSPAGGAGAEGPIPPPADQGPRDPLSETWLRFATLPEGGRSLRQASIARSEAVGDPITLASTDTFTSVADACVLEGYPEDNLGTVEGMLVGYDELMDPDGKVARGLVLFDLAGLPDGQEITEAMLRLYLTSSWDYPATSRTVTTYRATQTWLEDTVTWNSQPATGAAYGTNSVESEAWGWYEFDVTDLVRAWYDGTFVNHGIVIRGPEVSGEDSSWRAFDTTEGEDDPELVVAYSAPTNAPPNAPSAPTPADGATGVMSDTLLAWTGGDPDDGDIVTYDVYLEASDDQLDTLICANLSAATCDPGGLTAGTRYYWYVEATDDHEAKTTGPTWDFTTAAPANSPPHQPTDPSPTHLATGVSPSAHLSWSGGDPDPLDSVTYDVYLHAGAELPSRHALSTTGIQPSRPHSSQGVAPESALAGSSPLGDLVWVQRTDMPTARNPKVAQAANGKIYAVGGYDGSDYLSTVEEYDPSTDSWTTRAAMPTPRTGFGLVAANGKLYAIGGYNGDRLATVEEYNPSTNSWTVRASMPTARSNLGAVAAVNGKVYCIGGNAQSGEVDTVEEYDPTTNSWMTKTNMPTARAAMAVATAVNGKIYAVGGDNGSASKVEAYDPTTDAWAACADMPTGRDALGLAAGIDGRLYAVGGTTFPGGVPTAQDVVEVYDPATDAWATETSLPRDREYPGVVGTGGGKIYVIGGVRDRFSVHGGTQRYRTVYEATVNPFHIVCADVTSTTCNPGPLLESTGYAWYVVSSDNHGASSQGDTWYFITTTSANEAPSLGGIPDQTLEMNGSADKAVDLWAYASDPEDADASLAFTISNTPAASAGVSIDSNRYVDINPAMDWTGTTDVQIQVTDSGGLTDTDTFEVSVLSYVTYLPLVTRRYPPIPSIPTLHSIDNIGGSENYTVTWSAPPLAVTYLLQEDDNAGFSTPTTAYLGTSTSWYASGKRPDTYYYRVRASNAWGASDWSNVRSVTVAPPANHFEGASPSVSFDVEQEQVCNFEMEVPFEGSTCTVDLPECMEIVDGQFSYTTLDPWLNSYENAIAGTFVDEDHVTGDYSVHFCENTLAFVPSEGDWEAAKQ